MDIRKYIKSPEDFVVKEIIDEKFLRKYKRTGKCIEKMSGDYTLFLVRKRNMTTEEAVKIIAKIFGVSEKSIGYAGLKDKFAVTEQYMTIKKYIKPVKEENLEVIIIGKINRHIGIGDLIKNEFEITLHNVSNTKKIIENTKKIEKSGMKNFFGPQRFGINKNNHIIGRYLAEKKFREAEKLLGRKPTKKRLKFYINAYQSFLYNKELKKTKKAFLEIKPIRIPEIRIECRGGKRETVIKTGKIDYEAKNKSIKLYFFLPKGSYATALLEQIGL